MKLTVRANNYLNKVKIKKLLDKGKDAEAIEIDFPASEYWSSLDICLTDDNGNFLEYVVLDINKLKMNNSYINKK